MGETRRLGGCGRPSHYSLYLTNRDGLDVALEMRPSRSLIVFVFVADSFSKTGDIISGLEPLFAPLLQRQKGERFDPERFATDVSEMYGLAMHPYVALDLAPKLAAIGLLHPVKQADAIAGYIILDKGISYPPLKEEQITALTERFFDFSRRRILNTTIDFTDVELEEALFDRLITMEFLSIITRAQPSYLRPTTLRLRQNGASCEPEDLALVRQAQLDFLCADFLDYLYRTDTDGFELLSDISCGALLSEVVLNFRTPPSAGQDGSKLSIYFD